jgi:hypothetical protein
MVLQQLVLRQSGNANQGARLGVAAIIDAAPDAEISSFRSYGQLSYPL